MNRKIQVILTIAFIISLSLNISFSQERLQPGKIYNPGEEINAPMIGLTATIPEGWAGYLPTDTEMLLLANIENPEGSIYALPFDDTMDDIKERLSLNIKFEVENGIELAPKGDPFMRGEVLALEMIVKNSSETLLGYAEAKCADYGWCIVYLMITPEYMYEKSKKALIQFMDNSSMGEPTLGSLYANFDWPEKLKNKYIATYIKNPYVKARDQVWLCADGTFRSKLQQKGIGNLSKKHKGNRSGTWEGRGIGPTGELTLNFKKAAPINVQLELKDDKLFVNGHRFYVMEHNCK
jgi:hypothetical protein